MNRQAHLRPRAWIAALGIMGTPACLQSVDLRGPLPPPTPPVCGAEERLDPTNGKCAPCTIDEPPNPAVCPCGYTAHPAPFPYCEGDVVAYDCVACGGDITSCSVYDAATQTTTSCDLLADCCAALSAAGGSCCPLGADLICLPDANLGEYSVRCAEPTCCSGTECPNGDVDCGSWQTCDRVAGRCVPACSPLRQLCCVDCGCRCADLENPP